MTDTEKIKLFRALFKGRDDAFGAGAGLCVKEKLTDEIVKKHLTGDRRIGCYPLSPDIMGGEGTWWVAVDIDDNVEPAIIETFTGALEGLGITCYVERSKSKGYHIWVFFTEAVKASWARALMQYAIDLVQRDEGYKIEEIFPKQDNLANVDFGNYINLPLFGGSVKGNRTVFLNGDSQEPHADQWTFLSSVEKITAGELEGLVESELDLEFELELSEQTPVNGQKAPNDYADMTACVGKMMTGVDEGCRDVVAFTLACHFRVEKDFPAEATVLLLREWNQKNNPPLTSDEIEKKVKSAYEGGKKRDGYTAFNCENAKIQAFCDKNCPVFKATQKGKTGQKKEKRTKEMDCKYFERNEFQPIWLAEELMDENRFLNAGEQLYFYQDGVYSPTGERFIRETCRSRLKKESRVNRITEISAHINDLNYTENVELNTNPRIINLKNGMFDHVKAELIPHSPDFKSTIRIPVEYNQAATCPNVDKFFETTLPSDCIDIVDELFGVALIPFVKFEKAFMLSGTGANGKSTFLTLLENFIGSDNVSKVPLQELDENRFKRADLFGKLLNVFADLDSRALKSSTYFKTIVSGDAIDAERKHRDPFSFRPHARLVYSANQLPTAYDKTFAYYRRWCILPFPHQFTGKKADKTLEYKLANPTELSGLLNRALRGLDRLFKNMDFTESQTVHEALEDYKRQNDPLTAFVKDCCEFDPNAKTERTVIFDAYSTYCESEGFEKASRIAVYNQIRAYPQVGEIRETKARYFSGIKIHQMEEI